MAKSFTIGQLARATDTKVETIRYYEKVGLLNAPSRSASNYRTYGFDDLRRLSFARRARELDFTIDQVRTLITLADERENDCCNVDALTEQHLATIDRKIADLVALQGELTALLNSCRGGNVANCRIIEALARN